MGKKKSRDQLLFENRILRRIGFGQAFVKVTTKLITWGFGFGMVWKLSDALIAWSGKSTTAILDLSARLESNAFECMLSAKTELAVVLGAFIVAVVSMAYGLWQARLRRLTIANLAPAKIAAEIKMDKNRSSSGLTPCGDTHPNDQ